MGLSKDAQRLHLLFLVHLSLFILVFITSLICETLGPKSPKLKGGGTQEHFPPCLMCMQIPNGINWSVG